MQLRHRRTPLSTRELGGHLSPRVGPLPSLPMLVDLQVKTQACPASMSSGSCQRRGNVPGQTIEAACSRLLLVVLAIKVDYRQGIDCHLENIVSLERPNLICEKSWVSSDTCHHSRSSLVTVPHLDGREYVVCRIRFGHSGFSYELSTAPAGARCHIVPSSNRPFHLAHALIFFFKVGFVSIIYENDYT